MGGSLALDRAPLSARRMIIDERILANVVHRPTAGPNRPREAQNRCPRSPLSCVMSESTTAGPSSARIRRASSVALLR